jgi:hypothetical protein
MEKKGSVGFMELGTKPIQGVRMVGSSAPYWLSVALRSCKKLTARFRARALPVVRETV